MCTRQQCIDRISEATPYIQREFGVQTLCIFGSVARGDNHEGSDVDVCVDMPPKMLLLLRLKRFLEELVGTSVDLVRLHRGINPFFLSQIQKDAIYIIQ